MAQPKLRFRHEDGAEFPEWKEKSIGSLCEAIGDGLHKAPIYDINGDYYFINGNNLKNGKIFIEKETPKVSADTIQQSDKQLDSSTILMSINGTIGNLAYYYNENVMLGKSVAYLHVKSNVCKNYIYFSLQTKSIINKFKLSLTGTTIKNLGLNAIRETSIFIPCLEEQQKVADFLSSVDEVIAQSEAEVQNLEQQKKATMQKIFSQEVRFRREDGTSYPEWKNNTFSETFSTLNNNTFSRDMLSDDGTVYNIHYGDILVKFGEVCDIQTADTPKVNANIKTDKYDKLKDGDIIIADTAEDETVGKATEICRVGANEVVSGLHTMACRPNSKFAPKYLGYYINSPSYHNQLIPFMQGIKVTSIGRKNIADTIIYYPTSLEEQQKIADLLSAYDEAISYAKQELDKWKKFKKGLMQQMFV